MRRTMPRQYFT